jgi:hypothetical protein
MNIFFKMCVMNIYGDCVLFTGVQTTDEEMLEISPCELVSLNIQCILLGQLSFSFHGYWLIAMASIVKPVLQGNTSALLCVISMVLKASLKRRLGDA